MVNSYARSDESLGLPSRAGDKGTDFGTFGFRRGVGPIIPIRPGLGFTVVADHLPGLPRGQRTVQRCVDFVPLPLEPRSSAFRTVTRPIHDGYSTSGRAF